MQTKRLLTALSVFACFAALVLGVWLFQNQNYYLVTAAVLLLGCLPFCRSFRTIRTRELVVVATMTAIAVASRGAFYMLPSVKPLCAIVILTGIACGAQVGFISGALAMFLSNFIFGQGPWTPFQVFGMGLTAFVAAALLRKFNSKNSRVINAVVGGLCCFVLYGLIADTSTVLMSVHSFSWQAVLSVYAAGLAMNAIHAVTTAIVLFLLTKPMDEKLGRIKIKYGLFKAD